MKALKACIAGLVLCCGLAAAEQAQPRQLAFETSEGTWMSIDAAGDGQMLYFDLLGQIYRVAASGGRAECLTQNPADASNYQPKVSPDGRSVAFISDRNGQSNLWLMDSDGGRPRPVALDPETRMMEPAWTPDGNYLVVRQTRYKHDVFAASLVMYHRDGGKGVVLVPPSVQAPGWPSVSSDGQFLYYHVFAGTADLQTFTSADVLKGDWQLRRLNLRDGTDVELTSGRALPQRRASSGGAYAPEVSPDGRWLAFARRVPGGTVNVKGHGFGPRTALWLRDLHTGAERVAMDPLDIDMAEEFLRAMRVLPGYAWSSDSRSIFISRAGRLRRLDVTSSRVDDVPFTAHVSRQMADHPRPQLRIGDGPVSAKAVRWSALSPDRRRLVFQAFGRLWIKDFPDGAPRRLTPPDFDHREFTPAWSPDGERIAFVTWDEINSGKVWTIQARGGKPQALTAAPGEFLHPSFSSDGRYVLVTRGEGLTARGQGLESSTWAEIVRLPATGGDIQRIVTLQSPPRRGHIVRAVNADGARVFYTAPGKQGLELVSVDTLGADRRVHAIAADALDIVPSPDARWVAVSARANVFVAPLPYGSTAGAPVFLSPEQSQMPIKRLSEHGGLFPRWVGLRTVAYSNGANVYVTDVDSGRTTAAQVSLQLPRARAGGKIAFTGARLVTMSGEQVLEDAAIVVADGRISCVGTCSVAGVDRVVSADGATIVPGFVDAHAHHHREDAGLTPLRSFEAAAFLAYGVTTTFDPAPILMNAAPQAELIETGGLVGPRMFHTAEVINVWPGNVNEEITDRASAEREVRRRLEWGASAIKIGVLPRREQRRWVAEAAHRAGALVVAEALGDLEQQVTLIVDGYDRLTHPTPIVPLHADATQFFGKAGIGYSPTFLFGGLGPWAEDYYFSSSPVWRDRKQQQWMPWRQLVPHARRVTARPATDYAFPLEAQTLADITAAGGFGAIGSHGQQHGIGSHWELWSAATAMSPMQALRTATLDAARFIGIERDVGSLEVGKIADLVVLDANPLEDMHNSLTIRYVMKDGVLYHGDTLDEEWPRQRPFGPKAWVNEAMLRSDELSLQ